MKINGVCDFCAAPLPVLKKILLGPFVIWILLEVYYMYLKRRIFIPRRNRRIVFFTRESSLKKAQLSFSYKSYLKYKDFMPKLSQKETQIVVVVGMSIIVVVGCVMWWTIFICL